MGNCFEVKKENSNINIKNKSNLNDNNKEEQIEEKNKNKKNVSSIRETLASSIINSKGKFESQNGVGKKEKDKEVIKVNDKEKEKNENKYTEDEYFGENNIFSDSKESKKIDNEIKKERINSINKALNSYSNFDIKKTYYLVCPYCKERSPHIEKIKYDSNNNDFEVNFKCNCLNSLRPDSSLLNKFLSIDKPLNPCINHPKEILLYYCENCKKSFCKLCKEEHKDHKIEKNNNPISKENIEIILKQTEEEKNQFLGVKILVKTLERYLDEIDEENISFEEPQEKKEDLQLQYSCSNTLDCFNDRIISLIELKSGWLVAGSFDFKMIYIWLPEDNFSFRKIQEIGYVFCLLEFEPFKILSGTSEGNICLRELNIDNDKEYNFLGHEMYVNCLIKIDKKYFASASNDSTIRIWDYYERKEKRILIGHVGYIFSLIKLNNGNLCSGGEDQTIKFWDWEKGLCLKIIENSHTNYIKCLCQFNDNYIISGDIDKNIKIWENYKCIGKKIEHEDEIKTICQIDETHFASGSFDNTIKIWDFRNFTCIQTLKGHSSNVNNIIKLKNNCLASCSSDRTIKIWKMV